MAPGLSLRPSNIDHYNQDTQSVSELVDDRARNRPVDSKLSYRGEMVSGTAREEEGGTVLADGMASQDSMDLCDDVPAGSSPRSCASTLDDSLIALGTIRLYRVDEGARIKGRDRDDVYPHSLITQGLSNRWISIDGSSHDTSDNCTRLRVYAVPEDVDRSRRGSMKDYRKVIAYVLPFIDRSVETWQGFKSPFQAYEMPACSEKSLFYIFNTLDSPAPDLHKYQHNSREAVATTNIFDDCLCGLKTPLYPYQKRSIAVMIQKETHPRRLGDPRKVQMHDMNGAVFFLDVSTGALYKDQPLYTEPRGGILAETMGYGKTLICLALILATRGRYPQVPPDRVDEAVLQSREKVGSLLSIAARRLRHEGLSWKSEFYEFGKAGYHYSKCVAELQKYSRSYFEPIYTPTTPQRQHANRVSGVKIHLCYATLVIVPPNLIIQWQQEITKHIEDGALDVLVLSDSKIDVPPWSELCKYDVVLMSKTRFEQEFRDDDLRKGKKSRGESDYRSPLSDVRWLRVICDEGHGFAGASQKTNAMAMLDKMVIERRWVVSGTPSKTLHGVEIGMATEFDRGGNPSASPRRDSIRASLSRQKVPTQEGAEGKDLERLRLIVVNFLKLQPWANGRGSGDQANWKTYLAARVGVDGTRYSAPALREVMQSLIVRHRIEDIDLDLQLPPLHNKITYLDPSHHDKLTMNNFIMALVSNYVTSEREDEDYMFHPRNRKKLDLLISNMRNATFHWIGWTDEMLRETIRVSRKYISERSDKLNDADRVLMLQAIYSGERALADPSWRAMSRLHEIGVYISEFPANARSYWALDGADEDPVLMGTTQARAVQSYVHEQMRRGYAPEEGLVGAGIKAMLTASKKVGTEGKDGVAEEIAGNDGGSGEAVEVAAEVEQSGKTKMRNETAEAPKLHGASRSYKHSTSPVRLSNMSAAAFRSTNPTDSKTPVTSTKLPPSPVSPSSTKYRPSNTTTLSPVHHLPPTRITAFTSSKLTYLISRLLFVHPHEKTIIFYSHNNTAYFVAEALELISVNFRIYANTLPMAKRGEYLARFCSDRKGDIRGKNAVDDEACRNDNRESKVRKEGITTGINDNETSRNDEDASSTSNKQTPTLNSPFSDISDEDDIKVLLMDLKQAGQGLHIAAASRIYILTPIWDRAVESQAIKRAHRIGQDKPVYVETLVLKGTFEEEMVMRRDRLMREAESGSSAESRGRAESKNLLDDTGIVDILKNIKLLPYDQDGPADRKHEWLPRPIPLFQPLDLEKQLNTPMSIKPDSNGNVFTLTSNGNSNATDGNRPKERKQKEKEKDNNDTSARVSTPLTPNSNPSPTLRLNSYSDSYSNSKSDSDLIVHPHCLQKSQGRKRRKLDSSSSSSPSSSLEVSFDGGGHNGSHESSHESGSGSGSGTSSTSGSVKYKNEQKRVRTE